MSSPASVLEVMPGSFSILIGSRSITVHAVPSGDDFELAVEDNPPQIVAVHDTRDRIGAATGTAAKGPAVVRAQMPGKVIKLLVTAGATVEAGQGLLVIEAMKMQNEVKSPKAGTIAKIQASEGATVTAGETLLVVD